MATKEEGFRNLTAGELRIARTVFKDAINYGMVKVYNGEYFPFGMQNDDTAVTPNGNMYWPPKIFKEDFSQERPDIHNWFIHEMVHVWQYQMGLNVRARGIMSWATNYNYSLPDYKLLANFNMEQQACIIADYFSLVSFGINEWSAVTNFRGIVGPNLIGKYQNALKYFLISPRDRKCLWN
ncbi:hypothetical protein [Brenneria corticis]|uniref:Type IV secretion protein Rhs n=1 Tax=Brenneria corticis TaxID=2173106 RepID=A0A2U1TIL6_9GAMM|nr:hypothetical protein [Brenneria sp. CFCC 11842]PWC09225.1 hypothetical protein DDT56_24300 [Brenneria sp. CFCC 11842]